MGKYPIYSLAGCLLLLTLGCGEGTPVAPSSAVLIISANPIEIGPGEVSVLTITALRSTGNPVNPGTEIILTTTLGSVPGIVTTDERGLVIAHLTAGPQSGTATVTAASGGAASSSVTVDIGAVAASLNLTANPARLSFTGGSTRLILFVLDADGDPLTGASVFFATSAGTLDSKGAAKQTNVNGQAADTLRLSRLEAAPVAGSSIQATARVVVGGTESSVQISIAVDPVPAP